MQLFGFSDSTFDEFCWMGCRYDVQGRSNGFGMLCDEKTEYYGRDKNWPECCSEGEVVVRVIGRTWALRDRGKKLCRSYPFNLPFKLTFSSVQHYSAAQWQVGVKKW